MEYLTIGPRTAASRWAAAQERKALFGLPESEFALSPDMSLHERAYRLVDNFQRGYFVIPSDLFIHPDYADRKRGPTKNFLRKNDLRPLRQEVLLQLPLMQETTVSSIPAQTSGIKFSTPRSDHYVFRLTDLISAIAAYKSVYPSVRIEGEPDEGRLVATFQTQHRVGPHDSDVRNSEITATLFGIGKGPRISAEVSGIPSHTYAVAAQQRRYGVMKELRAFHAPKYPVLQAVPADVTIRNGEFSNKSTVEQWDSLRRTSWRDWNGRIVRETEPEAQEVSFLYRPDLLGVLLIDGVAKEGGYEINHPFFRFPSEFVTVVDGLYNFAVLTEQGERKVPRRRVPTYEESELLFNIVLAALRERSRATRSSRS